MNLLIIFCPPGRASRRYYPETRAKRAPIPGTGSNRHDFPTGRAGRSLFAKALLLGGTEGSNLLSSSSESAPWLVSVEPGSVLVSAAFFSFITIGRRRA